MQIEFLGAGSCLPEQADSDTASLLIDRHILVDTGWSTIRNLKRTGLEPHDIDTLFFTHMHQDHYMGLVQFLFYLENGDHSFGSLKIYGPEGLEDILRLALTYTGFERYYKEECGMPNFRQLTEGETVLCPRLGTKTDNCAGKSSDENSDANSNANSDENSEGRSDILVSCIASHHAVPGFSYRFTSLQNNVPGSSVVYSGDTAPYPEFIPFAKGADVMIHEASFDVRPTPAFNPYGHASCMDAANAAKAAGVKALYMVHASGESREATLQTAGAIFSPVYRPQEGDVIEI